MNKYIEVVDSIEGWFVWEELCPLLKKVDEIQAKGHILEIGIHHGKSFIPMTTLLKEEEIAVAVDVFEDQQYNYDLSGNGSTIKFKENILKVYEKNSIFDKIRIVKKDSTKMNAAEYLSITQGNKYRIISIDGCHTKSATLYDLNNAIQILTDDGIIILDDYFNAHWPGVKFGVDLFMAQNADFRLVYLNANKFIICHKGYYSQYIDLLGELKGNNAQAFESRCWLGEVFKKQD